MGEQEVTNTLVTYNRRKVLISFDKDFVSSLGLSENTQNGLFKEIQTFAEDNDILKDGNVIINIYDKPYGDTTGVYLVDKAGELVDKVKDSYQANGTDLFTTYLFKREIDYTLDLKSVKTSIEALQKEKVSQLVFNNAIQNLFTSKYGEGSLPTVTVLNENMLSEGKINPTEEQSNQINECK
jgi:hypothetical protein